MATSAAKEKRSATKRGRKTEKKTAEKRQLVEEIIKAEPKKRGRKPKTEPDVKPINRGVKPVNLGQRAALARQLEVSTQTVYNREAIFCKSLPEYIRGLHFLPRKGGALKEYPDLNPYQQFCHFQLEKLKQGLGFKDCTPTEMLIKNNPEIFDINLFERQQQLTVGVEVNSSEIEKIETSEK